MSATQRFHDDLADLVKAAFAGIWVESPEPPEFLYEFVAHNPEFCVLTWDPIMGLRYKDQPILGPNEKPDGNDPTRPSQYFLNAINAVGRFAEVRKAVRPDALAGVLLMQNFHSVLTNPMGGSGDPRILTAVAEACRKNKESRDTLAIVSPQVRLPIELERLFVPMTHPLPDVESLREVARGVGFDDEKVDGKVLKTALGLTRTEAENAFALSALKHAELRSDVVWGIKVKTLKKSGVLELYESKETFDTVCGLEGMKQHCVEMIESTDDHPDAMPRGILLAGAPGTGKSAFAKALGNRIGWPTIALSLQRLKDKFVGESTAKMERALKTVDAMAPCVLFIDEVEKALGGVGNEAGGDSGVSDEMFGLFLTWLNDHKSQVYPILTANRLEKILKTNAEFARAERFDAVFFVDLPTAKQRDAIWKLYLKYYGLDYAKALARPDDSEWTGAEIRSCCRKARRRWAKDPKGLIHAAEEVTPIAVTGRRDLLLRREHASSNGYIDAESGKRYAGFNAAAEPNGKPARKVLTPK